MPPPRKHISVFDRRESRNRTERRESERCSAVTSSVQRRILQVGVRATRTMVTIENSVPRASPCRSPSHYVLLPGPIARTPTHDGAPCPTTASLFSPPLSRRPVPSADHLTSRRFRDAAASRRSNIQRPAPTCCTRQPFVYDDRAFLMHKRRPRRVNREHPVNSCSAPSFSN